MMILQVDPELGGVAKEFGEAKGCIYRNTSFPADNLADPSLVNSRLFGETIGRDSHRLEKLLQEYLPWVDISNFTHCTLLAKDGSP